MFHSARLPRMRMSLFPLPFSVPVDLRARPLLGDICLSADLIATDRDW